MIKRLLAYGSKYIDYRMAIAGSIFMALVVFGVNYYETSGFIGSFTASLKQGAYTFFFGGIIMRSCERLATGINKKFWAILAAVIIPSIVAITLTYLVHSLKGTPLPVESTIPTAILILPATLWWALKKRTKYKVQSTKY